MEMKLVLTILILALSGVLARKPSLRLRHNPPPPKGPARRSEVIVGNFTQKLDHFDSDNTQTWLQRYFVNTEFFNTTNNNVAFLLLGGEGDASESWMTYGSWIVTAQKYGALLFQLEHRFYGASLPFPTLTTENLRYLSSRQAIEDAADFIKAMNEEYSLAPDVKWIVFGGSYSGSLAAWVKLKHPELVQGAMAASAPLIAKFEFPEYMQVVIDDLRTVDEKCVTTVKTAFAQVDDLLVNPTPSENLTSIFNLCSPIEELDVNDLSVDYFYDTLTDYFAIVSQYNGLAGTVNDACDALADETIGKEIYRLAEIVKLMFGSSCVDYSYDEVVEYLRDTTMTSEDDADRQWIYQTCTEYGWYQTSQRDDKVFGRGCSIELYKSWCGDIFGPEFNLTFIENQITETNAYYGGLEIDAANVVYVHGTFDPWRTVGLTKTTHPESPVIIIEGTSHCANMYDTTEDELPQLTAAKEEVDRLIGVWLGFN